MQRIEIGRAQMMSVDVSSVRFLALPTFFECSASAPAKQRACCSSWATSFRGVDLLRPPAAAAEHASTVAGTDLHPAGAASAMVIVLSDVWLDSEAALGTHSKNRQPVLGGAIGGGIAMRE